MNKIQDWSSDDDSSTEEDELIQPSRDMPPSDNEEEGENGEEEGEEEYDYDLYELNKKIANNSKMSDLFNTNIKKEEPIVKKDIIKPPSKIDNILKTKPVVKEKRKFNPRLPPPNKNNKHFKNNNNFKINEGDFPTLNKISKI
jgi:hypothetical protein